MDSRFRIGGVGGAGRGVRPCPRQALCARPHHAARHRHHNDAGLIAECFAPDSRFITRLGGAEGLATVSAASPPGAKEELYWQNLRIVSVTETKPDEAVINAESDYLGEMINIVLKKEETGWVVASADAYPLPREARYPTTTTPTGEAK
jgi:hypothetical protein